MHDINHIYAQHLVEQTLRERRDASRRYDQVSHGTGIPLVRVGILRVVRLLRFRRTPAQPARRATLPLDTQEVRS